MDLWTLFLSWYVGCFLMSVWHGYNRYKGFRKNRKTCAGCVLFVSLVWPFVVPFLLFGIPFFVFLVSLWGVWRNGYDYLTKFMDDVVRKAIR